MLVDVRFEEMLQYLSPSKLKLISKGVDSVRQRVANLKEINPSISTDLWQTTLAAEFTRRQLEPVDSLSIGQEEMLKLDFVKKEYDYLTSWEWLYQYSPDFANNIEKKFPWGLVDIYMTVEAGKV